MDQHFAVSLGPEVRGEVEEVSVVFLCSKPRLSAHSGTLSCRGLFSFFPLPKKSPGLHRIPPVFISFFFIRGGYRLPAAPAPPSAPDYETGDGGGSLGSAAAPFVGNTQQRHPGKTRDRGETRDKPEIGL